MTLNDKDINELLVVLNTALSEARLRDMSGQPQEHINTYRAYMDTIRKWLHLFSQQVGAYTEESEA